MSFRQGKKKKGGKERKEGGRREGKIYILSKNKLSTTETVLEHVVTQPSIQS
jgi:hypothetical protein